MEDYFLNHKLQLSYKGFTIIEDIFNSGEVSSIIQAIDNANTTGGAFRKTNNLFAIRQFLKEIPSVHSLIFSSSLSNIIKEFFGNEYFVVKSIYFDKPEQSNWFVSYHQDLTIAVKTKIEQEGFSNWTVKNNQ